MSPAQSEIRLGGLFYVHLTVLAGFDTICLIQLL